MAQYKDMDRRYTKQKNRVAQILGWFIAWGPVCVWMILIFTLSSHQRLSVSQEDVLNFLFFKTLHLLEYGALYLLSFRALRLSSSVVSWGVYRYAFVITILYAISDELHQTFVPTREGTLRDVIIDGIGASIIWYFLSTLLPKAPKKLKRWVSDLGFSS